MKYFFFDYDGTFLIPRTPAMSERNREALLALKKAGHKVILCTGRCNGHVPDELWDLDLDAYCTSCGACIIADGKVIRDDRLDNGFVNETMKYFWDLQLDGAVEGEKRIKFYNIESYDKPRIPDVHSYDEYIRLYSLIPVHKLTLYGVPMKEEVAEYLVSNGLEIINNNNVYYEIIKAGNDKGRAVRDTLRYFGADVMDSYCFGDSMNDSRMLMNVGHSMVVDSAPDDVKEMADEIIPSVYDDGPAIWIENFLKESSPCL